MGEVERTLVLVKPDGVRRGLSGEVLRRIEAKGYRLVALELRTAPATCSSSTTPSTWASPSTSRSSRSCRRGPVVAAVVEGERVVEGWRTLMGTTDPTKALPGSIRGDLGRDWGGAVQENLVHGSDSPESAAREIAIWFPGL